MMARLRLLAIMLLVMPATAAAQAHWRLVEDLRIGGAETGPTSFDEIRDIAVDSSGRIDVLDYKAQEIRVFDANGRFLRLIGRTGAGPGEYAEPNGMRLAPDGELWVNDHNHGRYVVFDSNGRFARQVLASEWGFSGRWHAAFDVHGRLLEDFLVRGPSGYVGAWRRYDPSNGRWDTLPIPSCLADQHVDVPQWTWRTEHGGGMIGVPFGPASVEGFDPAHDADWCGAGIPYRIQRVRLEDGNVLTDISRSDPRAAIPRAVRDSTVDFWKNASGKYPPGTVDVSQIPRDYPRFQGMQIDDRGNAWVYRKALTGMMIDVWSPAGAFAATLDAPPTRLGPYLGVIRGDHLYTVVPDEDDVPFLVRYRIVR